MIPISSLAQPVGALMRPAVPLAGTDSLARAATLIRDSASGFVPVAEDGFLKGIVTERSLADCLAQGLGSLDSVESAIRPAPETLPVYMTGAEALRKIQELGASELPVLDIDGRLVGIVGASDLYPRVQEAPHLPMIGGMATPFGVYLTAGGVHGGARPFALIATGMLLSTVFLAATFGGSYLIETTADWLRWKTVPDWLYGFLPFAIFMAAIRIMPLSGTHAAEHMTVHAMEWGEPLELEVVKRMPRVHPRCGTNIAVAATLFLSLATWKWTEDEQGRLLVAMLATVFIWRPLGHFMQYWVTTRPPSDANVLDGIRAGKDLIRNYQRQGRTKVSFGQRLMASGLFHVMAGSLIIYFVAEIVAKLLGGTIGLW